MKDLVKNIVYAGVGAAFLTRDKIEELKNELVDKGNMTREEGKQFVDELIAKSEKARDGLELWINQRVEERIRQLNLATREDVDELKRKIEELQVALNK